MNQRSGGVERHIRPMLSGLGAGTGSTVAHDENMMPVSSPARFTYQRDSKSGSPDGWQQCKGNTASGRTDASAESCFARWACLPYLGECAMTVNLEQSRAIAEAGVAPGLFHHYEPAAGKDRLMMSRSARQARPVR